MVKRVTVVSGWVYKVRPFFLYLFHLLIFITDGALLSQTVPLTRHPFQVSFHARCTYYPCDPPKHIIDNPNIAKYVRAFEHPSSMARRPS